MTMLEKFRETRGIKKHTSIGPEIGLNFINSLSHDEAEEILDVWHEHSSDEFEQVWKRFRNRNASAIKGKDMLKALAKADYQDLKRYAFLSGLDEKWMLAMRGK